MHGTRTLLCCTILRLEHYENGRWQLRYVQRTLDKVRVQICMIYEVDVIHVLLLRYPGVSETA